MRTPRSQTNERRPDAIGSTIVFLHIIKTAGTTLRRIIQRNFPQEEILPINARVPPREGLDAELAAVPAEQRRRARILVGHIIYGLHEHLAGRSTYLTILREPTKLIPSYYEFIRERPQHVHHGRVMDGMSITDFISSGIAKEIDNGQTRVLAGDFATPFGECTDAMLTTAKANIDATFSVVGLTERFDETLLLIKRAHGWRHLAYVPALVSSRRKPAAPSDELRRLIARHTELDRELYAYAVERFDAAVGAIPSFDRDLRRFRLINRFYRPFGSAALQLEWRLNALSARGRARRAAG